MPTLKEAFQSSIEYHAKAIGDEYKLRAVAEELGLFDREDGPWSGIHMNMYSQSIEINIFRNNSEKTKTLLAELEPKLGQLPKTFDEGYWAYRGKLHGISIVIKEAAPACAYDVVEEEVEIDEVPAHTETKTRYVLRDPDCGKEVEEEEEQAA